ncbi:sigma-70 family RNA polymerase sigma factor [Bacillota bacterium Meth-B3]|nr:sigma-70 family RNA polymerase sigma factor [Christensenellaceae bacterium]
MSEALNQCKALIERAQRGDAEAMKEMVEDNLALVKYVVKRFQGAGRDWDDLYQLGCMGLVKAIKNFNVSFDVKFSTYAVPVILGEVRRFLRDDGPMRVSRSIKENARKIAAYLQDCEAEGTMPTIAQIAERVGLDREETVLALDSLHPARSLSEPVGGEGSLTLGDTLGADPFEAVDRRIELQQLMAGLDEQERALLIRRYFDRWTQGQIAEALGMTQVQVSRMESKLLKRLREIAQAV